MQKKKNNNNKKNTGIQGKDVLPDVMEIHFKTAIHYLPYNIFAHLLDCH